MNAWADQLFFANVADRPKDIPLRPKDKMLFSILKVQKPQKDYIHRSQISGLHWCWDVRSFSKRTCQSLIIISRRFHQCFLHISLYKHVAYG